MAPQSGRLTMAPRRRGPSIGPSMRGLQNHPAAPPCVVPAAIQFAVPTRKPRRTHWPQRLAPAASPSAPPAWRRPNPGLEPCATAPALAPRTSGSAQPSAPRDYASLAPVSGAPRRKRGWGSRLSIDSWRRGICATTARGRGGRSSARNCVVMWRSRNRTASSAAGGVSCCSRWNMARIRICWPRRNPLDSPRRRSRSGIRDAVRGVMTISLHSDDHRFRRPPRHPRQLPQGNNFAPRFHAYRDGEQSRSAITRGAQQNMILQSGRPAMVPRFGASRNEAAARPLSRHSPPRGSRNSPPPGALPAYGASQIPLLNQPAGARHDCTDRLSPAALPSREFALRARQHSHPARRP